MDSTCYVCSYCRTKFSDGASLEMHLMQNVCGSQDLNSNHSESVKIVIDNRSRSKESSPDSSFICGECRKCFSSAENLAIHIDRHRDEKTDTVFECGKCSAIFKTCNLLESHVKLSNCIVSDIFSCGMCSKVFVDKMELEAHLLNQLCFTSGDEQLPESEYKCGTCEKKFPSMQTLISHTTSCSPVCTTDKAGLVNDIQLNNNTVDQKENSITDKPANITLNENNSKENHIGNKEKTVVKNTQKYMCSMCNRYFVTIYQLEKHKRSLICQNSSSTRICRYCKKQFSSSFYRKVHENTTCINKKPNSMKCRHCQQSFSSHHDMTIHEKTNVCRMDSTNALDKDLANPTAQVKSISKGHKHSKESKKGSATSNLTKKGGKKVATKTLEQYFDQQSSEVTLDYGNISGISLNQDSGAPITMYHDLPVSSFVPEVTQVQYISPAVHQETLPVPYIPPPPLPPNMIAKQIPHNDGVGQPHMTPVNILQPYSLQQTGMNYSNFAASIPLPAEHTHIPSVGPAVTNGVISVPPVNVPHNPLQTLPPYSDSRDNSFRLESRQYPSSLRPHLQRPTTEVGVDQVNMRHKDNRPDILTCERSNNKGVLESKQKGVLQNKALNVEQLQILKRSPNTNWYFRKYRRTNRTSRTFNTSLLDKIQRINEVVDNIKKCNENKAACNSSIGKGSDMLHADQFKRMHLRLFNQQWMQKKHSNLNIAVTIQEHGLTNSSNDSETSNAISLFKQKHNLIHTLLEKRAVLNKLKESFKLHKTGVKKVKIPDKSPSCNIPTTSDDQATVNNVHFQPTEVQAVEKVYEGDLHPSPNQINLEVTQPPRSVNSDIRTKIVIPNKGLNTRTISTSQSRTGFPAPRNKTLFERNISTLSKDHKENKTDNVQPITNIETEGTHLQQNITDNLSLIKANIPSVDSPTAKRTNSETVASNGAPVNTPASSYHKVKWSMLGGKPIDDKLCNAVSQQAQPNNLNEQTLSKPFTCIANTTKPCVKVTKDTVPTDTAKSNNNIHVLDPNNTNALIEQTDSVLVQESQVKKVQVYLQRLDSNFINNSLKLNKRDKENIANKETSHVDVHENKIIDSKDPIIENTIVGSEIDQDSDSESDSDSEGYEEIDIDIDEDEDSVDENQGKQTCVDINNENGAPQKETKCKYSTKDNVTHADSNAPHGCNEAKKGCDKHVDNNKKQTNVGKKRNGLKKLKRGKKGIRKRTVLSSSSSCSESDDYFSFNENHGKHNRTPQVVRHKTSVKKRPHIPAVLNTSSSSCSESDDDFSVNENHGKHNRTPQVVRHKTSVKKRPHIPAVLNTSSSSTADDSDDHMVVRRRTTQPSAKNTSSSSSAGDSDNGVMLTESNARQQNNSINRSTNSTQYTSIKKGHFSDSGSSTECHGSDPDEKSMQCAPTSKHSFAEKKHDESESDVTTNTECSAMEITIETDYDTDCDMKYAKKESDTNNSKENETGSKSEFNKNVPKLTMVIRKESEGREVILKHSHSGNELHNDVDETILNDKIKLTDKTKTGQKSKIAQNLHVTSTSKTGSSQHHSTRQRTQEKLSDTNDAFQESHTVVVKGKRNISKRLNKIYKKFDSTSDDTSSISAAADLNNSKINANKKRSDTSKIDIKSRNKPCASAKKSRQDNKTSSAKKTVSKTAVSQKNVIVTNSTTTKGGTRKRKRKEDDNIEAPSKRKRLSDDTKHSQSAKHLPTGIIKTSIQLVQQTQELNKEEFVCGICQEAYPNSAELEQHMLDHAAEKAGEFVCGVCRESFHEDSELQKHIVAHFDIPQNGFPPVVEVCVCEWCKQRFTTSDQLLEHKQSCSNKNASMDNVNKYSCKVCSSIFGHIETLNEHQKFCDGGRSKTTGETMQQITGEGVNGGKTEMVQADSSHNGHSEKVPVINNKTKDNNTDTFNSAKEDKSQGTAKKPEQRGSENAKSDNNRLSKLLKFKPKTVFSWQ